MAGGVVESGEDAGPETVGGLGEAEAGVEEEHTLKHPEGFVG